jgi:hypothetical protein
MKKILTEIKTYRAVLLQILVVVLMKFFNMDKRLVVIYKDGKLLE